MLNDATIVAHAAKNTHTMHHCQLSVIQLSTNIKDFERQIDRENRWREKQTDRQRRDRERQTNRENRIRERENYKTVEH